MTRKETKPAAEIALERGLPANIDCERLVLGSVMLQGSDLFGKIAHQVSADEFLLDKHKCIWRCFEQLDEIGEPIDRMMLAQLLIKRNELESVDGLTYLNSLDEGIPKLPNLEGWVRILRNLSALRKIAETANSLMTRALLAEDSSSELLASGEAMIAQISASMESTDKWASPAEVIARVGAEAMVNPQQSQRGIQTGWKKFDSMISGLQPGEFSLLAGRPSHGKSAAALQIARHVAISQGVETAIISLEMSDESMVRRMVCGQADIDSHMMRSGWLSADARTRARVGLNVVNELPVWINDSRGMTASAIRASLKSLIAKRKIGLIIVDHFHLVDGHGKDDRARYNAIADSFQRQAQELGAHFMALCQLNRESESEGRPPGLSDLREAGNLEQNADLVVFTYRPEMYAKNRDRQDLKGHAEFIIAKQRNGPIGKQVMWFKPSTQEFFETTSMQEEAA